jgi:phosphoglycolate phosphatase
MKLIFYDLDGTIIDTRKDIARAANYMREQMGLIPLEEKTVERYVGRGLQYLIEGCLETKDQKAVDKGAKFYRRHYEEHMLDHSRVYPGVVEVLEHFKDRSQAVVTNKPNPFTDDMLEALKIRPYFSYVIAGSSEYPKKPNPAAIHALMKKTQSTASEALFIGDSLIDIQTCRNAGIRIAVLTHGFNDEDTLKLGCPDYLFSDFIELLKMAKEKRW